jgi:fluoroquinolone transport system ATP-binding protein
MDKDLVAWDPEYYENLGVSFEVPNHYLKLTALENLTYFGSLFNRQIRDLEELLGLVGLLDDGDMIVSQFSKGMKNRVNVARSLLHNPDLLFLDEPTAGLDPVNGCRIKDLIHTQRKTGKTIFLATHDMSVANELCDRLVFIVDGQISLIDSPRQLGLSYG